MDWWISLRKLLTFEIPTKRVLSLFCPWRVLNLEFHPIKKKKAGMYYMYSTFWSWTKNNTRISTYEHFMNIDWTFPRFAFYDAWSLRGCLFTRDKTRLTIMTYTFFHQKSVKKNIYFYIYKYYLVNVYFKEKKTCILKKKIKKTLTVKFLSAINTCTAYL